MTRLLIMGIALAFLSPLLALFALARATWDTLRERVSERIHLAR